KRATLTYRGDVATKKYGLVTSAFTKGLLDAAIEGGANMINATSLAKDRGIELVETVNESAGDFSTRVGVKVETESGSVEVDGTVFGNQYLRLIGLDGFHLESLLDGTLLIYRHEDRPGVIGAIGSVLGKHEINIADMALGRSGDSAGGSSVAVLHLDSEPTAEVVAEVAALPHVTGVDVVKLPGKGEAIAGVTA
ncbi:MAG: ACT domain-containing protein, partial [Planctomycetota bacterium]